MIIMLTPHCSYSLMDIIIEEQAQYYGQRNQHVIDYLRYRTMFSTELFNDA